MFESSTITPSLPSDIDRYVTQTVSVGQHPFVSVVIITNETELKQSRGSSFVNNTLAEIFNCLRSSFPKEAIISQVKESAFGVAIAKYSQKEEVIEMLRQSMDLAQYHMGSLPRIAAAAFLEDEIIKPAKGDRSTIDAKKALDYALYAASAFIDDGPRVQFFSIETTNNVLYNLRKNKLYDDVSAEYRKMIELGISFADTDNQAALSAFEKPKPDLDFALDALNSAVELQPDHAVFHANLALIKGARGDWLQSAEEFKESQNLKQSEFKEPYLFAYTWALYIKYSQTGDSSFPLDQLHKLIINYLIEPHDSRFNITETEIENAAMALEGILINFVSGLGDIPSTN